MRIMRKFPPNPNLVLYYTDQEQTQKMAEFYYNAGAAERPLVKELLTISGVRCVQIIRYEIRIFKKRNENSWQQMLPKIEEILKSWFAVAIEKHEEGEEAERIFAVSQVALSREVYEGKEPSQQHPIAAKLFEIPGVQRVICDRDTVIVKKSRLFSWNTLQPLIKEKLSSGHDRNVK